jgi:hypothetical protein
MTVKEVIIGADMTVIAIMILMIITNMIFLFWPSSEMSLRTVFNNFWQKKKEQKNGGSSGILRHVINGQIEYKFPLFFLLYTLKPVK